ncbi:MAG TPA: threonine/serine dehydratase [Bryobacteraceae bacterium]|nr:threonine/serine dehydratase [Bryobacteraceae bacterium]
MPITEPTAVNVTFADIQDASHRIRPIARRTPVLTSRGFDERAGTRTFFKCENLQRCGAFKIRGASNFLLSMPKQDLPRGVVSFSSGNHAQAVAFAAKSVGAPATLVMPEDAPRSKMEATRDHGARIVTHNRFTENREAIGRRIAAESGATLVPPFDHPWIIAGQGTAALELLEEIPDLDALVVCIGGGGLISGCAIAAKYLRPAIRIFGVEPEIANDTFLSLQAGHPVEIPAPDTIADGLRTTKPGAITFSIMQQLVDEIVLVTEREIEETLKFLLTRMKILVEPSGAVAAAALLFGKLPPALQTAGVILSGGNVDADRLAGFLR